jgi:hypothetical protein
MDRFVEKPPKSERFTTFRTTFISQKKDSAPRGVEILACGTSTCALRGKPRTDRCPPAALSTARPVDRLALNRFDPVDHSAATAWRSFTTVGLTSPACGAPRGWDVTTPGQTGSLRGAQRDR